MDKIIIADQYQLDTLVAISEEDHINGLMYHPFPPPIMTFPYNKAEVRKFWMRNTISPLDIVFCNNNKITFICYGEPLSLKHVGPNFPTDMVVELPHGLVKKLGVAVSQNIKLQPSIKTVAALYRYNLNK